MPQAIPMIVAAAATAAGATATVVAVLTLVASIVTMLIFKPKMNTNDLGQAIQNSRGAAESREIVYGEIRKGGTIVFYDSTGTNNEVLWMVVVYADHEIDSYQAYYIDDTEVTVSGNSVTTSPYNGFVNVYPYLGTDSQTADATLDAAVANWTTDHRLRGCAYVIWKLTFDRDVFPSSLPNLSVKLRGKKVYDCRLDSTNGGSGAHRPSTASTWAYSVNPVLCHLDYMRDSYIGPNIPWAAFSSSNIAASANICDENVTVNAGGTIDRYTCNGTINSAMTHADVIDIFTRTYAGTMTYSGGVFRLHPGAYDSPALTFNDDDILSIEFTPKPSRKDLVNAVKGLFIDKTNSYQPADYVPVTNSTYETEDGGERFWLDVDFPLTTDYREAQRVAKISLLRARNGGVCAIRTNLRGMDVKVWDTITVQSSTLANGDSDWTAGKIFRVLSWKFDPASMACEMELREEASTIYSWTAASDEGAFTPAGGAVNVFAPGIAPDVANLVAVAATMVGSDGSKIPAIKITYDPASPWVVDTIFQLSPDNGTTWYPIGTVDNIDDDDGILITGLVKGTTYKVRAVHRTTFWTISYSGWATSSSVTISDTTIAGTILNQGTLATLNAVGTSNISTDAVTGDAKATGATATLDTNGANAYVSMVSQSYTPYSTDSKIMLIISGTYEYDSSGLDNWNGLEIKVKRGATTLETDVIVAQYPGGTATDESIGYTYAVLDQTPGSSTVTYAVEGRSARAGDSVDHSVTVPKLAIFEGKR